MRYSQIVLTVFVLVVSASLWGVASADDGPLGMRMISVPAGEFRMGALNTIPKYRPELRHSLRGRKFSEPDLSRPDDYIELTSTDVEWQDTYKTPWTARLKGSITAPTTGQVIFTADADEGIRLVIGKQKVIDVWAPDHKTDAMIEEGLEVRRGVMQMEQGKQYPVVLELWVENPDARFRLLWEWEEHGKSLVPIEAFRPTGPETGQRLLAELGGPFTSPYGDDDERPVREVRISRSFLMSESEVTADQYREFKPDYVGQGAAKVNWHDAVAFCRWLSQREGKTYRLPTEAEWEYACRAGTDTWYGTGDTKPRPVQSNAWGLKGMNAEPPEWVHDWYGPYPDHDEVDPVGPTSGFVKVVRGGPVHDGSPAMPLIDFHAPYFYRSANRAAVEPTFPPPPCDVPARGRVLAGEMFRDANLQEKTGGFYMSSLDQDYGPTLDYHGGPGWIWSARVTGTLNAPATGEVLFRAEVHEGIRLKIDGTTVFDGWGIEKPRQGAFPMVTGKKYRFTVEMFETHNRGKLTLWWSRAGQPESVIPMTAFDEQDIPPLEVASPIGFRIVQAPPPQTAPRPYRPAFAFHCVKQTVEPAACGPDPKKPWLKRRPILPVPPEDIPLEYIQAAGLAGMGNHNEAPALVSCPNGDLLAIYYSAPVRYGEYYPHVPFIVTRLRCGAEQWDMPEVMHHQADIVGASALLWREADKLWMFFGGVGLNRIPFRWTTSNDNGVSWAPVQLPRVKGTLGTYSPQPITTMVRDGKGTLYLSCDGHFRPATWSNSLLWATDDNGHSWYDTGGRAYTRHAPYVLMKDGKTIMAYGGKNTQYDGFQSVSYSTDGGKHWRREKTPFPMTWTKQRPSLVRLQSGRLFFASDWQKSGDGWQPPGIDQKGVYVALSDDDGKTWHVKTLEAALAYEKKAMPPWLLEEHFPWHDHDTIGYSVATQSPNGLIHLITTSNHPAQHFEMNEAWILSDSQRVSDAVPNVRDVTVFEERDSSGPLKVRWEAGIGSDGRYLLHGKETHYDQDGHIQYEVVYDRGVKVGAETLHRPNGGKIWSWDHQPEGLSTWTTWWSSGRKKSQSTWRGVRCHGVARCWNSTGLLTREVEFEDGHPISP